MVASASRKKKSHKISLPLAAMNHSSDEEALNLQQSSASLVVVEPRQLPSMTSLEQATQILTAKEPPAENRTIKTKQLGLPKPNSSATSIDPVSSGVSSGTAA